MYVYRVASRMVDADATNQVEPHPMMAAFGEKEWTQLSPEERQISARKMEVSQQILATCSA
jgi:hypothetical protein